MLQTPSATGIKRLDMSQRTEGPELLFSSPASLKVCSSRARRAGGLKSFSSSASPPGGAGMYLHNKAMMQLVNFRLKCQATKVCLVVSGQSAYLSKENDENLQFKSQQLLDRELLSSTEF